MRAAFALPALRLLPREAYAQSHWVTSILSVNALFSGLPQIYGVTFSLKKSSMPLARATVLGALVTVAGTAALIGPLGKEGAAIGVVAGTITYTVVGFIASQRVMPIKVDLLRSGVAALALFAWGGYFVMLPRADAIELDMSVDEALKYIISMGTVAPPPGNAPCEEAPERNPVG